MSGHFLLAPIPESSSDYLLPKDIKLAVLGAGRVGKSGECYKGPRRPGVPTRRDAVRLLPAGIPNSPLLSSGRGGSGSEGRSSLAHHLPPGRHSIALCPGSLETRAVPRGPSLDHLDPLLHLILVLHFSAMIVRFLTKRFIGDYEPNTG